MRPKNTDGNKAGLVIECVSHNRCVEIRSVTIGKPRPVPEILDEIDDRYQFQVNTPVAKRERKLSWYKVN